jgi:hypothetical protein
MGPGILDCFDELFHDMGRSGKVGVPHPQVDDVVPPSPGLHLEVIDDGKNIGRQPSDPMKFFHGKTPRGEATKMKNLRTLEKPPRFALKNKNLESRSGGSFRSISKLPNPRTFVKNFGVFYAFCPVAAD